VLTKDCAGESTLGDSHWDVYRNQGGGFASEATRYTLPSGGFPMPSDADHCHYRGNRSDRTYTLTDIDGDGLPDLVLTKDCGDEGTLGDSHWDVYRNQGGGFASEATRYALPPGGFPMASDADHCDYTGNRSDRTYTLTDMDHDGRPDLVVTGDCTGESSLGSTHWDVYRNQGDGFETTAQRFTLPQGSFPMPADADHCDYRGNRTDRTYTLTDVNRDGRPDLVLTAECSGDADIGTTHWAVYLNGSDGFAAQALTYALPAGGFPMASDWDHCDYTGNRTDRTYALTDLDGDALPDLVLTGECAGDPATGQEHWAVYPLECDG